MTEVTSSFGMHLRTWRERRRLTQMELALRANVSTRHLGFVELGRSLPSRSLILRLAEDLDIPLRERNTWLLAAGYAPAFENKLHQSPPSDLVRSAIEKIIEAHKPYPAFAIDRNWDVILSNGALPELYDGIDRSLLEPPVNVMRLTFHPRGLAPRILNYKEWAEHLLTRLRREFELSGDQRLAVLLHEAEGLHNQSGMSVSKRVTDEHHALALPLRIRSSLGDLSFFSTVTIFGTATDITLSELALEMLYPADHETDTRVRAKL